MSKMTISKVLVLGIAPLIFLPGCDMSSWSKQKETQHGGTSSEAVITCDGKSEITATEFKETISLFMQAQPQLEQLLPYLPKEQVRQMFRQVAEGLRNEREIVKEVHSLGLDKTPEYVKQERQVMDAVKRDLAVRTYQNYLLKEISISDAAAKEFYDENRGTKPLFKRPPFVKSMGGISGESVVVTTEKEAKDLVEQAKRIGFDAAAKAAKKSVNKLEDITFQTAHVDASVHNRLMGLKQFPTIDYVKRSDNKYEVFNATGKTEEKFAPYEDVKDQVKEVMSGDRFNEMLTQRLAQLTEKYKCEIHDAVLDEIIKEFAPSAAAATMPEEAEEEATPASHAQQA